MKSFIFSIILFISVVSSVIAHGVLSYRICDKYCDMILTAPMNDSPITQSTPVSELTQELEYFNNFLNDWEKEKTVISISVNHARIREVDDGIYSIIGACKSGDRYLYSVYMMQTYEALNDIRDMCVPTLDTVI